MPLSVLLFTATEWLLAALIFAIAGLYAAVGHGGSSGYQAAMALLGVDPALMKPIALTLNIVVSFIATVRFLRAGYFSLRVFLPFALSSVPMAFIGGGITLPPQIFKPLIGLVLLFAAFRLVVPVRARPAAAPTDPHALAADPQTSTAQLISEPTAPHWLTALAIGAALGLLSGMVGVGGGIFLSPLLVFMNWARLREISGISALFILVNSAAGLAAQLGLLSRMVGVGGVIFLSPLLIFMNWAHLWEIPGISALLIFLVNSAAGLAAKPASQLLFSPALVLYALAAVAGGWLGAGYGSLQLGNTGIRRVLAGAILIAGVKMLLEGLLPA